MILLKSVIVDEVNTRQMIVTFMISVTMGLLCSSNGGGRDVRGGDNMTLQLPKDKAESRRHSIGGKIASVFNKN